MIPYSRQTIRKKDINEVTKVLKSNFLTQGPKILEFEQKLNNYVNSKYCTVMANGTAALHAACFALELTKNDIVWTSPISFVASANCAAYFKAKINFIDINKNDGLIDVNILEKKLKIAKKNNLLPKIIIVVHFAGNPCNLKILWKLSKQYKFKIIEDASHALGAIYNNTKIGSCMYSDITTFSFHPVKNITTGEGGATTTNKKIYKKKIDKFISHGIFKDNKINSWNYKMKFLGFNYRLTDIQAALGISQLSSIEKFIQKKTKIKKIYDNFFSTLDVDLLEYEKNNRSGLHLYVIKLKNKIIRKKLYNFLLKNKIKSQIHYIPINSQPYYLTNKKFKCPEANVYYDVCLSLPFYPSLTLKEVNHIKKVLLQFFKN